jgi:hypothetical protein
MRAFGEDNIPLGYDIVEIPFVWIPDGCDVPRPGHAWFKAGWFTLSAEQLAAWPPSSYLSLRGEVGAGPGVTLTDRQANPTTLAASPTAEVGDMEGDAIAASQPVWPERSVGASPPPHSDGALAAPDVRAATQPSDALSDPHLTVAVRDAVSRRNGAAQFASPDQSPRISQPYRVAELDHPDMRSDLGQSDDARKAAAERLSRAAEAAYERYSRDCSHAVWEVLKRLVDPGEKYRTANDLMATMARPGSGWRQVSSMQEASKLADEGKVVVAAWPSLAAVAMWSWSCLERCAPRAGSNIKAR